MPFMSFGFLSSRGKLRHRRGAVAEPPVITTVQGDLPASWTFLEAVGFDFEATGGNGSYTWTVESGTLPTALSLDDSGGNPEDGHLHGTITDAADDYVVVIRCTDDDSGLYDEETFTLTVTAPTLPGTPTLIYDIPAQTDITGSEYNSLEDSSGNGYDAAYISGGKGAKSAALQLDGNDTLLTQNNGFNDGTLYRTAGGVLLNSEIFPTGEGTVMFVGAVKAFKHLFTSTDFVMGGSTTSFRPVGFVNTSNVTRYTANGVTKDETGAPSLDTYYVFTVRFNATNLRGQIDNGTELTQAGDARVALAQPMQFFYNGGDAGCFEGYVAFIICWPTALNDGQVIQAKTYLRYRFNSLLGGI